MSKPTVIRCKGNLSEQPCRWPLGVSEGGRVRIYPCVDHHFDPDGVIRATCPNCLTVRSLPGRRTVSGSA